MKHIIALCAAVVALVTGAVPSEPGYLRHASVKPSTYIVINAYLAARQGILEEVSEMLAGETGRVFTNTYYEVTEFTNRVVEVHSVTNNFHDEFFHTNYVIEVREYTNNFNNTFWYTNNTHEVHSVTNEKVYYRNMYITNNVVTYHDRNFTNNFYIVSNQVFNVTNNFYHENWYTNNYVHEHWNTNYSHEVVTKTNNFYNEYWFTNNTHEVHNIVSNFYNEIWSTNYSHEVLSKTNNYYNVTNVVTHHYETTHETNNVYTVSNITEHVDYYVTNHIITAAITNNIYEITNRYIIVTNKSEGTALKVLTSSHMRVPYIPNVRLFDGAEADLWLSETGTDPFKTGYITQSVNRIDFDYGGLHWTGTTKYRPSSDQYIYSEDTQYRLQFYCYNTYWYRDLSRANGSSWVTVTNDFAYFDSSLLTTNIYRAVEEVVDRTPTSGHKNSVVNSDGIAAALSTKLNLSGGTVTGELSINSSLSVPLASTSFYYTNSLLNGVFLYGVKGGLQMYGGYLGYYGYTCLDGDYWTYYAYQGDKVLRTCFSGSEIKAHMPEKEKYIYNQCLYYPDPHTHTNATLLTDLDVKPWARAATKPTYTYSEVGALPSSTTSLKNPYSLRVNDFLGGDYFEYDGSSEQEITVNQDTPTPYKLTVRNNGASPSTVTFDGSASTTVTIPTALKNPYALKLYTNATQYATYDGSAEMTLKVAQDNKALTFTGASTGTYDGSAPLTVNIPSQPSIPSTLPNPYMLRFRSGSGGTTLMSYDGSQTESIYPLSTSVVDFGYNSTYGLYLRTDEEQFNSHVAAYLGTMDLGSYIYTTNGTYRMDGKGDVETRLPKFRTKTTSISFSTLVSYTFDPLIAGRISYYKASSSTSGGYIEFTGRQLRYYPSPTSLPGRYYSRDVTDLRDLPDTFTMTATWVGSVITVARDGVFSDSWIPMTPYRTASFNMNDKIDTVSNAFVNADVQIRTDFAAADAQVRTDFAAADAQVRTDFAAADTQIRTDFAAADVVLDRRITSATNNAPFVESVNDFVSRVSVAGVTRSYVPSASADRFFVEGVGFVSISGWPVVYHCPFESTGSSAISKSITVFGDGTFQVNFEPLESAYILGQYYHLSLTYYSKYGGVSDYWIATLSSGSASIRATSGVKFGSSTLLCTVKIGGGGGYTQYRLNRQDSNAAPAAGPGVRPVSAAKDSFWSSSRLEFSYGLVRATVADGGTLGFSDNLFNKWPEGEETVYQLTMANTNNWTLGDSAMVVDRVTGEAKIDGAFSKWPFTVQVIRVRRIIVNDASVYLVTPEAGFNP